MSIVLYEKPYAKIEYVSEHNLLKISWNGFVNLVNFKDCLDNLLIFASTHKNVTLFLSDQRKRKVLTKEESEWFANDFAPRFIKSRTKTTKLALIKSEDIFGAKSTENLMNKIVSSHTSGFATYAYFESENEAMNWLLAV